MQSQRHIQKSSALCASEGNFFFTLEASTSEAQKSKGHPPHPPTLHQRAAAGEEAPGESGLCGARRPASYARGTLNHSTGICPLLTALLISHRQQEAAAYGGKSKSLGLIDTNLNLIGRRRIEEVSGKRKQPAGAKKWGHKGAYVSMCVCLRGKCLNHDPQGLADPNPCVCMCVSMLHAC